MKALLRLLCLFLMVQAPVIAGGSSPAPYIGIHVQGEEYEGSKFVVPNQVNGKTIYFRISPDVVTRHFESFHAFVSEDAASFGAALKMNDEGMRAMELMCTVSRGRLARTIVNGRALEVLRVDRPGNDGYFIIWSGLTHEDIKLFSKKLKRLDSGLPGEEDKKKRR